MKKLYIRPGLKRLAVIATIGMFLLILGGALVTKTGSGDGCGTSWPLCKGRLIPDEISTETLIEASHRISTLIVLFVVIIFAYRSWRELGHLQETKAFIFLGIIFFIVQSLVGAARVIWGHADFVLALHFGISLISFAAVFLLAMFIFEKERNWKTESLGFSKSYKIHTVGIIIYCFIVIYSGAFVQHTKSSMICPDWPLCRNKAIGLPLNFHEWVQMGHRFLAGLLFLWIISMFAYVRRNYREYRVIYIGWLWNAVFISLQVLSGALVIYSNINLYISLLHAFLITCLFGTLSYMGFLVYRNRKETVITSVRHFSATKEKVSW